jgi:hypothetical protein
MKRFYGADVGLGAPLLTAIVLRNKSLRWRINELPTNV